MTDRVVPSLCLLFAMVLPLTAQEAVDQTVHKPGNGVSMPALVRDVKPSYTADALRGVVEGSVMVEAIVETDGSVGDVHVVRPLDPGLDEQAVRAVKQWRFKPGTRDGKPVRVLVQIELTFTINPGGPRLDSDGVFKPGQQGVTMPRVLAEVKPAHPASKRDAGIEGIVTVECVVLADGTVGQTRVTKSLDPDFDREAVRSLRQWRFTPGRLDGKAVPVQVSVEITFTLR